jgi:threonine dehydratase
MSLSLADVFAAQKTIAGQVVRTPMIPSPFLSERAGVPFLLKMETMQPTGAFKLRGATNAILNAPAGTKAVTCCSTGNHGRGVAYAARRQGINATICMSSLVPQNKVERIRALGADVRIVGTSQDDAMAECLRLCDTDGFVDISPFDDGYVISGQGTVGLEILQDQPDLDIVLVPLSGGGLAGGVALAAKAINPDIRVIAISMDRGAAMEASIKAGRPVEVTEVASLADSLGGGIGLENKLSFDLCRTLLDDIVLVSEKEIYRALQTLYFEDSHIAEGASVVGIAALLAGKLPTLKGPVATIITGRNVDMGQFTDVISGRPIQLGDTIVEGGPYDA